jgi:hypothetical protein
MKEREGWTQGSRLFTKDLKATRLSDLYKLVKIKDEIEDEYKYSATT